MSSHFHGGGADRAEARGTFFHDLLQLLVVRTSGDLVFFRVLTQGVTDAVTINTISIFTHGLRVRQEVSKLCLDAIRVSVAQVAVELRLWDHRFRLQIGGGPSHERVKRLAEFYCLHAFFEAFHAP